VFCKQKYYLLLKRFRLLKRQRRGDQIGGIFAYWAIVFFGHFIEKSRNSKTFVIVNAAVVGLAPCDTDFFSTSAGDPGREFRRRRNVVGSVVVVVDVVFVVIENRRSRRRKRSGE
jgi:hypothetical protein